MNEENPLKSKQAETEEKILAFWEKEGIFKKTLDKHSPKGEFVFYDGPPFATGEPHYGHVVPGTIKDIIPRYKTMQGYHVRRRWGWDCHGLPVENLVEKELKLLSKKDIIEYGIGKFNARAQETVMRYADDWRKIIPRLGRWVDMENDYRTMDATYTESVWWAFKELHKKGLIYEGFKSMNLCPRCETTISNFEVSQGYKDITDISVYAKFKSKTLNAFLLAWTTTPWTLPGNVALAINPKIKYVKIEVENVHYILAESRLAVVKGEYKNLGEVAVKDLIGTFYEPLFSYYAQDKKLKNRENGWKIYGADFVTTDSGTGIVHIAPAFGADDYELLLKNNLPFVQHVTTSGKFKSEVTDFTNQDVKPKDDHQKTDVEIIKYLAKEGTLFAKEKIIHSYPHCWRCDTPLLNYASSSWFVKVSEIRDGLVKENKKINWVPKEVGEGRFGNWLVGARDWAISRSRFWGAPLPVWKDEKTNECHVMGSILDLKKFSHANNTYYVSRHGESENNVNRVVNSLENVPYSLTTLGKKEVLDAAKWLKSKKIDMIFVSPFLRTRETAEIISKYINLDKKNIVVDDRIREINAGIWDGKKFDDFVANFAQVDRFGIPPQGGENYVDIKKRMGDFIYDIDNKYKGKNILIISHDTPLFLLETVVQGLTRKQSIEFRGHIEHWNGYAKPRSLDFHPLPHNREYELDLHRPFIDEIQLVSQKGNLLKRVPEVFDCWFESGSMPFGESHYPFDKLKFNPKPGPFSKILGKTKGYPADFIAEGLDQTRGWFYSLIVLGTALFGKAPFKNVVVNGTVLAEDGQKMSKRLKNYPDLMIVVNKYGADALRYVLMSSAVVKSEDFAFSEKGVDEVVKKHIGRLNNVISFYEMYGNAREVKVTSTNSLDIWIENRLEELKSEMTSNLEKYQIDKAARPIADFINDLSTWYIRRSRDRFKSDTLDKQVVLSTTRHVLLKFAKLIAPFMPFLAEDMYQKLKGPLQSVHLESWGEVGKIDLKVLTNMQEVRRISSLGLEARMKAKINVRQPLSKLIIKDKKTGLSSSLFEIIKDEVNVKEIAIDDSIFDEVSLDTTITPELAEEGKVRELIRSIQDLRKEKGLTIQDRVTLVVSGDQEFHDHIMKNKNSIMSTTLLEDIIFESILAEVKMDIRK